VAKEFAVSVAPAICMPGPASSKSDSPPLFYRSRFDWYRNERWAEPNL
jgi:hypothetical protein